MLVRQFVREAATKKCIQKAVGTSLKYWVPSTQARSYSIVDTGMNDNDSDQICELAASNLRFGPGSTKEVGQDLQEWGLNNVIVVTDPNVANLPTMKVVQESLEQNNISYTIYKDVRVEPNDASFQHAIAKFQNTNYQAVVAVGGGSAMDTAKAANLYASYPTDNFYEYVNPPLGKGKPVPGPLPPFIAIPTTAGTGSETTGVAIFDDTATHSKTGIAHRRLKPTLAIVDSNNTETLPKMVAAYSGLDVLCHAMESYTALPFTKRSPKPTSPNTRPAYQGSNPISDVWSMYALQTTSQYIRRAVHDGDIEARSKMLLAAAAAGMGFGNAGVHLCHGMSYPIASQVKSTYASNEGYDVNHAMIPHGLSVIVSSPAVFRFTSSADTQRHYQCAQILQQGRLQTHNNDTSASSSIQHSEKAAGEWLAEEILYLTQDLDVPIGLTHFGYSENDIPSLVQGTLPQHRVTKLSPRPVGASELETLFHEAMHESY